MHFWRSVNRIGRRTPGSFERASLGVAVVPAVILTVIPAVILAVVPAVILTVIPTVVSTGNGYGLVAIGR